MKVLVAQSFPTLYGPMNCSLPDSSVHGILQPFPSLFPSLTQESDPGPLHCKWILLPSEPPG